MELQGSKSACSCILTRPCVLTAGCCTPATRITECAANPPVSEGQLKSKRRLTKVDVMLYRLWPMIVHTRRLHSCTCIGNRAGPASCPSTSTSHSAGGSGSKDPASSMIKDSGRHDSTVLMLSTGSADRVLLTKPFSQADRDHSCFLSYACRCSSLHADQDRLKDIVRMLHDISRHFKLRTQVRLLLNNSHYLWWV